MSAFSDQLLTAQLKLANLVDKNVIAMQGGSTQVNWWPVIKASRGINVVSNRISLGDTSSSTFQAAYACMSAFVGNYAGGAIDPNAQSPGSIIQITVNPPAPIDPISWAMLDAATQNPDGNRSIFYNPSWKGFRPVLSLISPADTALVYGVDFVALPTGGIQILTDLSGAGTPGLSNGQDLRASAYVLA